VQSFVASELTVPEKEVLQNGSFALANMEGTTVTLPVVLP
jgi:hypothetical protein